MRILFVTYANFSQDFGATRHICELLNALADAGHEVTLAAPQMWKPTSEARFRLQAYSCPDVPYVRPLVARAALAWLTSQAAQRRAVDVVYTRDMAWGWLYGVVAELMDTPFAVQLVGFVDEQSKDSGVARWRTFALGAGQALTIRFADHVVATAEGIRDRASMKFRRDADEFSVVRRGIDLDLARPASREEARQRLGLVGDPLLVYVGSLSPWQGLETTVDALPLLRQTHPGARLIVVGHHAPLTKDLRGRAQAQGVADAVSFVGGVPYRQAVDYVNAADLCLAPYADAELMKHGPVSDKVLTYLACGRPVLVSTALAMSSDVVTYRLGECCLPDDPLSLAAAAARALARRDEFDGRREELRRYTERWSWPASAAAATHALEKARQAHRSKRHDAAG